MTVALPAQPSRHIEGELAVPRVRRALEAHIEALIALLDGIDLDPDLEPDNDDEPSLGWPEGIKAETCSGTDDREFDVSEGEPWLGSPEATPGLAPEPPEPEFRPRLPRGEPVADRGSSQLRWAKGGRHDREQDSGDAGEPDADDEHWRQPVHIGQPAAGAAFDEPRPVSA